MREWKFLVFAFGTLCLNTLCRGVLKIHCKSMSFGLLFVTSNLLFIRKPSSQCTSRAECLATNPSLTDMAPHSKEQ